MGYKINPIGVNTKAFSFLELLLSVFIISLFLSLSFPMMENFLRGKVQPDARKIYNILTYVNDISVMRKEKIKLKIDLDKKTISFLDNKIIKRYEIKTLSAVHTLASGMVNSGEITFFLSENGLQYMLTIYLSDKKKKMIVKFNPVSNRASIRPQQSTSFLQNQKLPL